MSRKIRRNFKGFIPEKKIEREKLLIHFLFVAFVSFDSLKARSKSYNHCLCGLFM